MPQPKTIQGTTNYTSLAKASARRANYTKKRSDHRWVGMIDRVGVHFLDIDCSQSPGFPAGFYERENMES